MATPTLRPRGTSELLGAALALCRANWAALVAGVMAAVVPLHALAATAALMVDSDTLDFRNTSAQRQLDHIDGGQLVLGLVSMVGVVLAGAACVKTVADARAGARPAARRSLEFALRRLPALLAQYVVAVVAIGAGVFAFILPAVWLLVAWSLAIPALLLDGGGPLRALGRSFGLVRGRWWATFGVVLVLIVVMFGALIVATNLVAIALGTPTGGAQAVIVFVAASTLAFALALPYVGAVLTLLYEQRSGAPQKPPSGWLPPRPPVDPGRI